MYKQRDGEFEFSVWTEAFMGREGHKSWVISRKGVYSVKENGEKTRVADVPEDASPHCLELMANNAMLGSYDRTGRNMTRSRMSKVIMPSNTVGYDGANIVDLMKKRPKWSYADMVSVVKNEGFLPDSAGTLHRAQYDKSTRTWTLL